MEQSAYITCMPDFGVVIPPDDMLHTTLQERAEAACNTIYGLVEHGLNPEFLTPTEEDTAIVADLVNSFAKNEEATNKAATSSRMSALRPAVILQIDEALTEFSHSVVKNAVQIRHFVTNKLLMESSNPDPRVRIRALELLGKISDVGLFTERSEVTVTHRSTEDLKQSLREKLDALRIKNNMAGIRDMGDAEPIEDAVIVAPAEIAGPLVADLDTELGIDTASALAEVVGSD